MSDLPENEQERWEAASDEKAPSENLIRIDVTGNKIASWTVSARELLLSTLRRILSFGKVAADTRLPGTDESMGRKLVKLPGKGLEFVEAKADQISIENKLKESQTETEFLKQELLRSEKVGQDLENLERMLQIQARIRELTDGRTSAHVIEDGETPAVVFGSLPNPPQVTSTEEIGALLVSKRTIGVLRRNGITTLAILSQTTKAHLTSLNGVGKKALAEIERAMIARGQKLKE